MRFSSSLRAVGLIFLTLGPVGTPTTLSNDDPPKPSPKISLFDGRTLEGWKPLTSFKAGKVSVEGDSLAMSTGEPMTGVTSTRADLPNTNYRLTFDAKRTTGNDFFAAATFPVGSSFVTLVTGGWGGSVTGLSLINGANAAENETNHFVKYQNDVWYTFDVQITTRVIRCSVDGNEVFAFDHEGAQLTTRIETRGNEPLGFATYRSSSLIRNIQVQGMTPQEIAETNARIKVE